MDYLKKGTYKTRSGLKAIIAQLLPVNKNQWHLRGAVVLDNVYYWNVWNAYGTSLMYNSGKWDLIK